MFERENKREKILEAKMRELKLRVKTAQMIHEETEETKLAKLSVIAGSYCFINFNQFSLTFI